MAVEVFSALRSVRDLVDALPDGVAVISQSGSIVFVNHPLEELTGYSAHELLNLEVEELVPRELQARHSKHRAGYARRPTHRPMGADLHINLRRKDGFDMPVDIALSPLGDGSGAVIAAIRDARLRRLAEDAGRRLAVIADRERMSRRLHEQVIHELFAVGLSLQALALEVGQAPVRKRLDDAVSSTDVVIRTLRKVIFELTDLWQGESASVVD